MFSVTGKNQYDGWLLPLGTLFFMCGILLGRRLDSPAPALIGLGLCLLAACWPGTRRVTLMVTAMLVGAALGANAYHPAMPEEGEYLVCGTVSREVSLEDKGHVQTVLSDVTLNGVAWPDAYWTYYLSEGEALPDWLIPGARVELIAHVYHPSGAENPGGFNFLEYLLQRDVRFGVYGAQDLRPGERVFSLRGEAARIRHELTEELMAVMGEEGGAYAAAMVLGNQDFIPEDDRAAFQDLGVSHILSVSGFHVGVLAMLLRLLLKPLPVPREVRTVLLGIILAAYCLLTGESAPVIRAAGLMLLRECVRIRNRQVIPLHLLCMTALIQLAVNPTLLTGPSFQLSYGAMLGVTVIAPGLTRRCRAKSKLVRRSWEALCVTAGAQIGVLVPQLYWFGELPLLGFVLNLFVAGLSGGVILLYWATMAALPFQELAGWLGAASARVTEGMLAFVRLAARDAITLWIRRPDFFTLLGWALLMVFSIGYLPEAWAFHRRRMLILGAALMGLVMFPLLEGERTYLQLSAGNADSALLQDRGMTVVIDTGEDGEALASCLHQRRLTVDKLIITHLHLDHAGGIAALLEQEIPVHTCYLPVDAQAVQIDEEVLPLLDALAATGTAFEYLCRGDEITLPSGRLTVLWPVEGHAGPLFDANDVCLVLYAEIAGTSLLLTGDLSGTYERYSALPADVLKVAHHGSSSSTSAEFLAAVSPQVLLLSNTNKARTQRIAELAGELPLFTTDGGAVRICFLGDGEFTVEKYEP